MKYVYIINKFSLKNKLDYYVELIKSISKSLELDFKIEVNSDIKSTEELVEKYKGKKVCIVAVGGDGMINRVINSLDFKNNYFSFVPLGTGNDFYRTNLEELHEGISKLDVVIINNKYFINTACFGLDADIANDDKIIHNKYIPKNMRYNVSVLKHFLGYKGKERNIKYDSIEVNGRYATIVVCNGRYYGGGYNIAPNALLNDGLLDVYIVEDMNKIKIAKTLLKMKNGGHIGAKGVQMIRTKKIKISSDKSIKSNIDGEVLEDKSFNIELLHNKINFVYNSDLLNEIQNSIK